MKVGMLWWDGNKQRPFAEKVLRAADYYREKYGIPPTLCYVHADAKYGKTAVEKIMISRSSAIMPNHFWLGTPSEER